MKILIISDTHFKNGEIPGNIASLIRADPGVRPDMVIHAGDFSSEDAYRAFEALCGGCGVLFRAVCGNCDPASLERLLPEKTILEEEGLRIGVIHAAGRSFDDHTARWYLLREMDVDILIFGHIHIPVIEEFGGRYLICPGSPTSPRLSDPTVMMLDIEKGKVAGIRPIILGKSMCGCLRFRDRLTAEKKK